MLRYLLRENGKRDGMVMKKYKNILVNALVNLGDVVLTTGAVALLKRAWPKAGGRGEQSCGGRGYCL